MKLSFLSLKMMVKSGLEFILKLTEPLQSCCCPVQKNLPSRAELAWQVSRYLWRVNFKINSRPLFTIIFKLENVNFKTRDFSPLIEWVLELGLVCSEIPLKVQMRLTNDFYLTVPSVCKILWLSSTELEPGTRYLELFQDCIQHYCWSKIQM